MKKLTLILTLIFSTAMFSSTGFADELKKMILKQIQAKEFLSDLYIEEYQALTITGDDYTVLTKKEIKELFEAVKPGSLKIKSFRILSRSEIEKFTSVTFEYEWGMVVGKTNMNGKISGIGVYLKTGDGYISIFDAQTG